MRQQVANATADHFARIVFTTQRYLQRLAKSLCSAFSSAHHSFALSYSALSSAQQFLTQLNQYFISLSSAHDRTVPWSAHLLQLPVFFVDLALHHHFLLQDLFLVPMASLIAKVNGVTGGEIQATVRWVFCPLIAEINLTTQDLCYNRYVVPQFRQFINSGIP